jgi:general secretion pathway protein D
VRSRRVEFTIEEVDFVTAMEAAGGVTGTFWAPLAEQEILIAADTKDQHLQYDRMVIPQATTAAQLNDIVNALRTIFELRLVIPQAASNSIAVRAPAALVDAATYFLSALDAGRPQVMLEMEIFEVSQSAIRNLGLNLPLQWQAFNVSQEALDLLQDPNIQDLINQLFATGGINQANSTAISALLAQLQSQQSSLLSQPFATFGGGSTLTAIPVPPATATFSRSDSYVRSLQRVLLRAGQGDPATMRIGSRFPILNATFAPIFNTGSLSQVIQGGSFTAPFPSFSYEDLGVLVKATPQIHPGEVTLALEIDIKALSAQSFNGVPVISNRAYRGAVRLEDGQAGVVAGTLDQQEQRSISGPPGIGFLPGLSSVLSTNSRQVRESELLIVLIPHIVSLPPATGEAVALRNIP